MNKTEPKRRRKLNDEQIEVLELLYKFRFASNNLIADYFGKKDRSFVFKRLTILLEQGLIGKRFDSSYRIQGKSAAYYLLPTGARILQERRESDNEAVNIKGIYKDKTVSEGFIRHCLQIFSLYNQLKTEYGDKLNFFTKADLSQYDYFPQPSPDAYMRLKAGKQGEAQFFLDFCHDSQPFFKAVRRVKQYIAYREEGEWAITETDFPTILFVCESASTQKRLNKQIAKTLDETYEDDITFYTTTKEHLKNLEDDAIWQEATDPDNKVSLSSI